jgi:hypothetical protein
MSLLNYPEEELKQTIRQHLSQLGHNGGRVANRLMELNIKGKRANKYCCPIANYLKQQEPNYKDLGLCVSSEVVQVRNTDLILPTRIDLQPSFYPVSDFIQAFDGGYYPELEE